MPGAPDPEYVAARRALLDALDALVEHRDSIVVVGAQAVYAHAGAADLSVPEFTTDADLAVDPDGLRPDPRLDAALAAKGFVADAAQPGIYWSPDGIEVDLMVPETLGGAGRRGARLGPHGNRAARKARGPPGLTLAGEAVAGLDDPATVRASLRTLSSRLLRSLSKLRSATCSRN